MSETEQTPIDRAASIIQLWESNPFGGTPTDVARDVFASVGVEGLAGEINRHAPSDAPTEPTGADCTCGIGLDAWEDIETADRHVAEAVKAWLTGLQDHEHRWISDRTHGDRGGFEIQSCTGCPATREEPS